MSSEDRNENGMALNKNDLLLSPYNESMLLSAIKQRYYSWEEKQLELDGINSFFSNLTTF